MEEREGTETESDETHLSDTDRPCTSGEPSAKKKRGRQNIMTTKLAAALDKCKVSDRNAVHIIIAAAEALGYDVDDLIINRSSIHRHREDLRKKYAMNLRKELGKTDIQAITVHWDGKLLPAITNKETVDRLPVVATFSGNEKLLGVPQIPSGTGRNQAAAVQQTLLEWGLL